jgi:NTP pyrophosphatase (non-canonical NTP hydrolase)
MKAEEFTTGLTDAERERLAFLSEECGEVVQAIGKIQRHGFENRYDNGVTNRQQLEIEMGHVLQCMRLLLYARDVSNAAILKAQSDKEEKLKKYSHFQK